MVEIKGLCKSYDNKRVVDNLSIYHIWAFCHKYMD